MGPRRYSRDRNFRRRQEQFEHLQWRCNVDYYTPTIRELRESGIVEGQFRCSSPGCHHVGERFSLTRYWSGLTVKELKRRQTCGQCWRRRVKIKIFFVD
jgi:hypothetical protein